MLKMISYTLFFTYQNNEALSTPATFDNITDKLYFYVSFQKKGIIHVMHGREIDSIEIL